MNEVVEFLTKNNTVFFSTIGLDKKPKVRPFQFMREKDGKLVFCTGGEKSVYKEIMETPFVEFSAMSSTFAWIRVAGEVEVFEDKAIKRGILDSNPLVKSIYQSEDNPNFILFYIKNAKAVICDFSGNPPKEYS